MGVGELRDALLSDADVRSAYEAELAVQGGRDRDEDFSALIRSLPLAGDEG